MTDKDNGTGLRDSKGPVHGAPSPSQSPKRRHVESSSVVEDVDPIPPRSDSPRVPEATLPLIRRSVHPPPPPGLVCSADPDPLLKDATRFVMEFDGYAGTPVNSIYDQCFLNKAFIDQHLSLPADEEKY